MTNDDQRSESSTTTHTTRRRFLQGAAASIVAGGAAAVFTDVGDLFSGSEGGPLDNGRVDGSVIVVGAGPAGMTAAHLLRQRGADVRVLEAASSYGGRIAHDTDFTDFTDFPIPLGAEWIHVDPSVLDDIVNDPSVDIRTVTVGYAEDDSLGIWSEAGELEITTAPEVDPDLKFVGSSWLDFFETYIVPGISSLITYDTVVERIAYGEDGVALTDTSGATHSADRVILTAPLKMLQLGLIEFDPPLPAEHVDAIDNANIWTGLKAFLEFDDRFYPTFIYPPDGETDGGQRLYYDAAYGQDTNANILGLFSVGTQAERYQAAGDDLVAVILDELDALFDGAASASYRRILIQDWSQQPFARAAYLEDNADGALTGKLAEPVLGRLFFAGDAYTSFDDWSSVHAAAWSARDAVRAMLT